MSVAILIALAGGALSAALYVSMLFGTPGALLLVLLAPLPLLLVGLSRGQGSRGALIAGGVGIALVGLLTGLAAAANYALLDALPACFLAHRGTLSRAHPDGRIEWYPAGRLTLWLSLYAGVAIVVMVLVFADSEGGLKGVLQRLFAETRQALGLEEPPERAERLLDVLISLMPGLAASSWLLLLTGNAGLAQAILARLGRNLRPSPELASYMLPTWLAGAVVLTGAAGILLSGMPAFVGANLCLVLAMPYFFGGLALIHALARYVGASVGAVAALYFIVGMFILILSWLAILGLAALGFIDQVASLRQRLGGPKDRLNGS